MAHRMAVEVPVAGKIIDPSLSLRLYLFGRKIYDLIILKALYQRAQFVASPGAEKQLRTVFEYELQAHVSAYIISTSSPQACPKPPASIFTDGAIHPNEYILQLFPSYISLLIDKGRVTVMDSAGIDLRLQLQEPELHNYQQHDNRLYSNCPKGHPPRFMLHLIYGRHDAHHHYK